MPLGLQSHPVGALVESAAPLCFVHMRLLYSNFCENPCHFSKSYASLITGTVSQEKVACSPKPALLRWFIGNSSMLWFAYHDIIDVGARRTDQWEAHIRNNRSPLVPLWGQPCPSPSGLPERGPSLHTSGPGKLYKAAPTFGKCVPPTFLRGPNCSFAPPGAPVRGKLRDKFKEGRKVKDPTSPRLFLLNTLVLSILEYFSRKVAFYRNFVISGDFSGGGGGFFIIFPKNMFFCSPLFFP